MVKLAWASKVLLACLSGGGARRHILSTPCSCRAHERVPVLASQLLECLYPNLKRTELAIISLEIKPFFNNNGELNETTFVDTVLHVISSHVVPSADERLKAPRSDVVEKWMSVKGVAVEGASSAASALRWGNLRTQFRALARSSSSQVQVTPAGGVNSRFAAPD